MGNYLLCSIDLTNKCNLACPYCYKETRYFDSEHSRDAYIDLDKVSLAKLADWLATSVMKTDICFQFHGGEPLIKWDLIVWFVKYIRGIGITNSKQVNFGIQTNGVLLTKEKVDWLLENDVVVGLSLDGTQEQQDANRPALNGKGSYQKIIQNVVYLLEKFPNTACQVTVVNPETMCGSLINLMEIGFKKIIFLPVYSIESESLEWQEKMACYHLQIAELIISANKNGKGIVDGSISRPIRAFALGETGYMCQSWPCGAGTDLVAMDVGGHIYPCDTFFTKEQWNYGHIDELAVSEFDDFIDKSQITNALRNRLSTNNVSCSNCSTQKSCGGGCPGVTFQSKGTINSPDVHCNYLNGFHKGLDTLISADPLSAVYLTNSMDVLDA